MKTILVINDNTPGAVNAAKAAFFIAQKMQANILIANTFKLNNSVNEQVLAGNVAGRQEEISMCDLGEFLDLLNNRPNDFEPSISEISTSVTNENQLAEVINQDNIWMVIKGTIELTDDFFNKFNLNFDTLLKKVSCPLMLIPENWSLKNIERLMYIADLRYCRLQIVRYLAELAKACHADLSIAHLSKKDIPDMDDAYAAKIFNDEIVNNVDYGQLFFNNIKEKDLNTAVDVIINGMHNDLLVMVKNRFHCNEIVGPYLNNTLPSHINIPLLIFPY